ncbi:Glycosyltransferase involved in cell wall bisynthesis [Hymenobacter gelipurpurascens]|uniref:Glycosyltransferase involved in cell wall bisynthesis n=1 Tax=Hymenobacter gelipurpurascens TaxID=89968 RepID=A0A212UD50_9BACT|nr:glycosyltransferase family 4 protein [Hymenobacter gelipurpurascens]SNC76031.1 Glycosyltransferase involved in cell wall bisynthesis [Hymenobacter gelipurpurascens]
MRVAIVINTSWNIWNFRRSLVKALQDAGHEVLAIAPPDDYSARLETELGCRFVPILMENKGTNPVKDAQLTGRFYRIYKREQPDVVLHYTIKPNIYGSIAAKLAGIPSVNNVSGLGTVFIVKNFVSKVALGLYRFAFRFPKRIFFQNDDDRQLFLQHGLVAPGITDLLPGSGIDTNKFRPATEFVRNTPFTFLMIARVLYEKGVEEYFEAARLVREAVPGTRIQLLGGIDESGGVGVKRAVFEQWMQAGNIEYLGTSDNVAEHIAQADCVVLPSYREGTPKTLLEAAAMGKPIVTTDVPGCRETVVDGQNGLLCEVRNAQDLAAKMQQVLGLSDAALAKMGRAGRELAEQKFDERIVLDKYLRVVASVQPTPALALKTA